MMIFLRFILLLAATTMSNNVQGFVMHPIAGSTKPAAYICSTKRRPTILTVPKSVRGFTVLKASSSSSASSSASSSSTGTTAISTTKARLSNQNNKKKQKTNQQQQQQQQKKTTMTTRRPRRGKGVTSQAITERELIDHVSSLYMRTEEDSDSFLGVQSSTTTSTDTESSSASSSAHKRLSRFPALILNADYQPISYLPLSLWNWQEAIKAVFAGKVTVVDVYPDTYVRAARLEIPLPSVMALNEYVAVHSSSSSSNSGGSNNRRRDPQTPAFTRRNVFLRDGYRCQYCALAFHTRDLSLDHVVPRSRGGRLTWNNAVTCCHKCNGRKGSLLPHELKTVGMKLLTTPQRPSQHQLAQQAGQMLPRQVHPSWKPYLEAVWGGGGSSSDSAEDMDEHEVDDSAELATANSSDHPSSARGSRINEAP